MTGKPRWQIICKMIKISLKKSLRKLFYFFFLQVGKLEIYDISSGQLLESVDAHDGPVWGLSLSPDKVCKQVISNKPEVVTLLKHSYELILIM